ncbi:MAG: hypothetical protein AUJ18_04645 [Candidatus Hydrogenedentes bacterium CG1_02_42_14]|nr:MAG: hypothetical protein AUJ18_04645 [Candidatus Hydrogenedentes bacterium CG1_02_42_14]
MIINLQMNFSNYFDFSKRYFVVCISFLITFILSINFVYAENVFPLDTDRRAFSASFGEYRPGRLHSGIDLATFGRTGILVRAVYNGWVYRVRSSAGGYGNVVYIDSQNNRRTVYAHLKRFAPKIAVLLPRKAHELGGDMDGNTMESYPQKKVYVRKGEVIGYNGEAGIGLPHLHFELRDRSDRALNPMRRGIIEMNDSVPPVIEAVLIEPADETSTVEGSGWQTVLNHSRRRVRISAQGRVRILVKARDEDGKLGGVMGLDRLTLSVNGHNHSRIDMNSFSFERINEAVNVYDPFLSGFSPTNYTYDLTAPDGSAEIVSGAGFLKIGRGANNIRITAYDANGNKTSFSFVILQGKESLLGEQSGKTEYITRGGVMLRRNGKNIRVTDRDSFVEGIKVKVSYPSENVNVMLAGGAALKGSSANKIYSFLGGAISPPPQAVGEILHIGPYGFPSSKMQISIPTPRYANGLAVFSNGMWRWLDSSRTGNTRSAELDFLAPVVSVRDTLPPIISLNNNGVINIEDDFSGVAGDKVFAYKLEEGLQREIKGRYDIDRRGFIPEPEELLNLNSKEIIISAEDRAGNKIEKRLTLR